MRVRQLKNALVIVELLEQRREMRFGELLERVETSRPSLAAMLNLLCEERLVHKTARGYALGLRFLDIARGMIERMDLRGAALPHLEKLHERTGDRIELAIPDDLRILYIHVIETPALRALIARPGVAMTNLHSLAPGKLLLTHLDAYDMERFFAGHGFYPATADAVMDRETLTRQFKQIRRTNMAVDRNEGRDNLTRFASAIFDHQNKLIGMVSLPTPSSELHAARGQELARLVRDAADAISIDIGRPKQKEQ